jgi:hypothetical protein
MRGTTPTHTFRVPIDLTSASVVSLVYAQGFDIEKQEYNILVEKEKPDMTITPTTVTVTLTQEETLRFAEGVVLMQIRARMPNGKAPKSKVKTTSADKLLKEGVI